MAKCSKRKSARNAVRRERPGKNIPVGMTLVLVLAGTCSTLRAADDRPDHNYQNRLPSTKSVNIDKQITDVTHVEVYKTAKGPKWNSWTRCWFTPEGYLRVSFLDITGGQPGMKPDYGYEYASAEVLAKQGIKRCSRWCESQDAGRTWKPIRQIDASDPLKPRPDFFLLLRDRSLLGIGGVWCAWDPEKKDYIRIGHTMAWRSSDGGATWSRPVSLNDPNRMLSFCCLPKQLRDGTIVQPAYGTFDRNKPSPNTDAWLRFSPDGGKSWSEPLVLARGTDTLTNDEPEVVELKNGDLLVVLRHANPKAKSPALYLNCGQIIVTKAASGWKPGPLKQTNMGFRGFPALLRTRDGVLICAGSGNQFNFSFDEGRTWTATRSIADPKYNRHNHYPTLVELADGRILSVYHLGNHWPYPPPDDQWIHATSFRLKR